MTDQAPDRASSQTVRLQWRTPEISEIDVVDDTEAFNGGAGDGNTGS